jgi:O-antigen/teichoic acid export membrane protein
MFKNILGTAFFRVMNAVITLLILIVNTNAFGREGMGTIGLLVLGISIILLLSNYLGGSVLVYLTPRYETINLFFPSYIWGLMSAFFGSSILNFFHLIPEGAWVHVMILATMQSFIATNQSLLLGKEKILLLNLAMFSQAFVTLIVLVIYIYFLGSSDIKVFFIALYFAYSITFLFSLSGIFPYLRFSELKPWKAIVVQILKYGKFIQTANVLQLLNYRVSFYIIEFFTGRAALGVFTAATQLSEGVWLVGKSVAMIQYSSISNSDNREYARIITLRLFKFTVSITALVLAVLLIVPDTLYSFLFSADFGKIKMVIFTLVIGVLSTAGSMIFSHYFSGIGKPRYNMLGSGIGLVITLVSGLILIPLFGLLAAGVTTSAAHLANLIYLVYHFAKMSGTSSKAFLISKEDLDYFRAEVLKMLK